MGSPVNLDKAAISRIIVPAQAVHVSLVSSGKFGFIPFFKLTWNSIRKTKNIRHKVKKTKLTGTSIRSITQLCHKVFRWLCWKQVTIDNPNLLPYPTTPRYTKSFFDTSFSIPRSEHGRTTNHCKLNIKANFE